MIRKAKFHLVLSVLILMMIFGCNRGQEIIKINGFNIPILKILSPQRTDPDRNLLLGEWSKTGAPSFIKITQALEIGRLEVGFYNPDNPYKIEIEKANWSKTGTLLTVYIELKHPEFPGSNFKLNYIPERDMLVGIYFDSMTGISYPVEFVRIQ